MIPFSHSNRQKFAPSPFSPSGTLLTAASVMVPQYMVWRQEVYLYAVCWSYEKCVLNITEVLPRSRCHHFKVAALPFQSHLRQPVPQRIPRKPQHARRLALVAVGAPQRFADDVLLVLVQAQPFRQKVRLALRTRARRALELNIGGVQLRAGGHHQAALNHVLQ